MSKIILEKARRVLIILAELFPVPEVSLFHEPQFTLWKCSRLICKRSWRCPASSESHRHHMVMFFGLLVKIARRLVYSRLAVAPAEPSVPIISRFCRSREENFLTVPIDFDSFSWKSRTTTCNIWLCPFHYSYFVRISWNMSPFLLFDHKKFISVDSHPVQRLLPPPFNNHAVRVIQWSVHKWNWHNSLGM